MDVASVRAANMDLGLYVGSQNAFTVSGMLLVVMDNGFVGGLVTDELNQRGVPALALTPHAVHDFLDQNETNNIVVMEEHGVAGRELCRRLIQRFPELDIVQLGEGRGLADIEDAHAAGVRAVVPKRPNLSELITLVKQLRANGDTNGYTEPEVHR